MLGYLSQQIKRRLFLRLIFQCFTSANTSWGLAVQSSCLKLLSRSLNTSAIMTKSSSQQHVTLIACGSFNPVTNMHLRMFEVARDHLCKHHPEYNVTSGILSPVSDGYGKSDLVSAVHRQEMCELAVASSSWLKVMNWELSQKDWTPTVQVLTHYEMVVNNSEESKTKLMLLCGSDFFQSFLVNNLWEEKDIRKIIEHFGLVVVTRPTYDPEAVLQQSALLLELKNHIIIVPEWVINDVSSTKVRQAVRQKRSIKYLIPDAVVEYIYKNKLYTDIPTNEPQELAPLKRAKKK